MSDNTVPGMADAIEARRRELSLNPGDFAEQAGLTREGARKVRNGARRKYQDDTIVGVARALRWERDWYDRLLAGEQPVQRAQHTSRPEQRRQFGDRLRALRVSHGMTQPQLGGALAAHSGVNVSGPAVSDWERGVSAPDQQNAAALEHIFGEPEGALAGMLGYSGGDPGLLEEVRTLRAEVDAMRRLLERLDRSLGGAPAAPGGE